MTSHLEAARQREIARLDPEILEAIGRGWDDPLDEREFDLLARDVFAHQLRFNPVYRQFCLFQGVAAAADVTSWREIPAVPTGAFKVGRWSTFPEAEERVAFRTSGTSTSTPGIHRFDSLALYNAAIVSSARYWLIPDRERIRFLFLSLDPRAAPDSSLVHMFAVFREAFGAPGTAFLAAEALPGALDRAVADAEPVLIAGAALAFHHALPLGEDRSWTLPAGSRAMVTGGFKGVRVATDPDELGARIAARTG
ncbi:MAG TPA: hypothetical protein VLE71_07290, partial [Actinomycetota bacterium]|nr:hypothetical protein [Actinomycetota bacterium]